MEIEIIYKSMPSCGIDSPLQTTTFDTAAAVFADRCVESGHSMYGRGLLKPCWLRHFASFVTVYFPMPIFVKYALLCVCILILQILRGELQIGQVLFYGLSYEVVSSVRLQVIKASHIGTDILPNLKRIFIDCHWYCQQK